MTKWEYRIEHIECMSTDEFIRSTIAGGQLDPLGQEGWEAVSVRTQEKEAYILLKRETSK